MPALATVPSSTDAPVSSVERTFRSIVLAVVALGITVLVMAGVQITRVQSSQHRRRIALVGREIQSLAWANQWASRDVRGGGTASERAPVRSLAPLLDSLVRLTEGDPELHALARSARRATLDWERRRPPAARALPGTSDAAPFETLQARLNSLLDVEEARNARWLARDRTAYRAALVLVALGLLALAGWLHRTRRRTVAQTARIVAQHEAAVCRIEDLAKCNAELETKSGELTRQNEELRLHAARIEEQTIQLAAQAATLVSQDRELVTALDDLRSSEQRLRTVVGSMSEMVYTLDRGQRYTELFGTWIGYDGVTWDAVAGRTPDDVFRADLARMHRQANESALAGTPATFEWQLGAIGHVRYFSATVSPVRGPQGDVIGLVGVAADITEQRMREEGHRRTEEQLQHTQRLESLGQLAGGVAHDFNNLLTVVLSYCDMLRMDRAADDPDAQMVGEIQHAALRGAKLTAQLLAFGRQQTMRVELLDMNGIVRRTERLLGRLLDASIILQVRHSPETAVVRADAAQLELVLLNLAINARDAMPQGGTLTIEASIDGTPLRAGAPASSVTPAGHVVLTVSDTGTGMHPDILARVFEPFFTTKAVGKGTGLGLAMVHGIVNQSAGEIGVTSAPGRGTTFRIVLPRAEASAEELEMLTLADPDAHDAESVDWDSGSYTIPPADPARREPAKTGTILLVDDEHTVREVVARLLTREGHTVIQVDSAIDALHVLEKREQRIDLVLSDVVMPHMSGRELAYEVRIRFPEAGIVLMSGYSKERALHGDPLGTDTIFLDKPFTVDRILAAIREGLAAARQRARRELIVDRGSAMFPERPVAVIVNSVDAIIWEADARSGRLHYVNRRAESLLGYPLAEWRNDAFFASILHPDDAERVLAAREAARHTLAGFRDEYRVLTASWQVLWMRDQVHVAQDDTGGVTQLRGVMTDITAQRLAEAELQRAMGELERERGFLSVLMDNLSDGIVACDDHANLTLFNHAGRELHGLPAEPIGADQWAAHYDLFHGDGVTPMVTEEVPLFRALRGEWVNNVEMVVVPNRGAARSLLASGRQFGDATGAVRGAVVAMRDVTEIKRAERDLVRAKEAAERANAAKSQFLLLVSHELRTPLTAVIGFALVLRKNRRGVLLANEITYLDRIAANGRRLLGLVDDLLELTNIESGASSVRLAAVALQEALPDYITHFDRRHNLATVALSVHVPDSMAPIQADPVKLRLLIIRLVDSALRYTAAGSVEVRVVPTADGSAAERIEVADTGIGVAPALIATVFAPFVQGSQFAIRQHGGMGVGLHLARRYCELMGFALTVTSEPGTGSTFAIQLRQAPKVESFATLASRDRLDRATRGFVRHMMLAERYQRNVELFEASKAAFELGAAERERCREERAAAAMHRETVRESVIEYVRRLRGEGFAEADVVGAIGQRLLLLMTPESPDSLDAPPIEASGLALDVREWAIAAYRGAA